MNKVQEGMRAQLRDLLRRSIDELTAMIQDLNDPSVVVDDLFFILEDAESAGTNLENDATKMKDEWYER